MCLFLIGHSGKVLCMAITKQSQYLLTGSEDISIIVWDLKALTLHLRIYEHIAPVLCVTSALSNSVIVSGGDDSSIIITSLANGKVVSIKYSTYINFRIMQYFRLYLFLFYYLSDKIVFTGHIMKIFVGNEN